MQIQTNANVSQAERTPLHARTVIAASSAKLADLEGIELFAKRVEGK